MVLRPLLALALPSLFLASAHADPVTGCAKQVSAALIAPTSGMVQANRIRTFEVCVPVLQNEILKRQALSGRAEDRKASLG